ncbi:mitochondrial transcription rescue factor 1 [Linepithema humile]|uniref:mitochondrial transcription rescue factor 1 n=1 Tax=Linepithema humile TaxID=83485 RepID=UPI00062342A3|nr:PREDICTED: uncharacterized protein C6orf203 homolog [Linepithema humile]
MLSRVTVNIIRRSICNNARALYCAGDSVQSNLLIHDNSTKQHSIQKHCNLYNLYIIKRFKSRKKTADSKKSRDEDSDEEDDAVEAPIGSKALTVNLTSLRFDALCKAGFGITRNKIEEAFYASKFRINGKKVFKKSVEVEVGDEIDLVLHRKEDNPDFLVVNRILILSMSPGIDNVRIKISRDKNLLIEDYDEPWSV